MLTGNKDVDMKILNELEDIDLVNACRVNKQADEICNNQVFWMNRVFQRFSYVPGDVLRKYKGNRSWSEYYIKDLIKVKDDLFRATIQWRPDHIYIAIANGADINIEYGYPLSIAAGNDQLYLVEYMLNNGANFYTNDGSPLTTAADNGHLNIVKYLIENIPAAKQMTRNIGSTPLYIAAHSGHLDIVKYLIENFPESMNFAKKFLPELQDSPEVYNYIYNLVYDRKFPVGLSPEFDRK